MLKYSVFLYFLLATVSGQLQNQSARGQLLSSVDEPRQGVPGPANSANPKPCRRRNNVDNSDITSSDTSLLQKLYSESIHPLNQKLSNNAETRSEIGTSQILSEYTVTVPQDPNELVQKDTYIDSEENDVPLIFKKGDVDSALDNENKLCQSTGKNENVAENNNEQTNLNTDSKNGSNEVHKQVLELLSKCAQKQKDVDDDDNDDDEEEENEGNTRRSNSENKQIGNRYAYQPSNSSEETGRRKFRTRKFNDNERQLQIQPNPAQGEGISKLGDSKVLLLNNRRVCFACTTTNDPTCWNPDHTTTVKYCKKEDDACITKTFKAKNDLITVRDCGNSCTDTDFPGVPLRYKSCRICHSDQCNGADARTSFNMLLVVFVISAFKFTF